MIALMVTAVACLAGAAPEGPLPADAGYESQRAAVGRDAASQVRLALWCEAHGLERERLKHLAIAVLTEPSNAMARGLMGLVEYQGKWRRPEAVAESITIDVAHADLIAEYNGRRVKTPVAVSPQFKLAQWCEEKGLKDEARAHLATVVRLDPNHAEAWKRLGYKKVGTRWITDAQAVAAKAEHDAQQKADKAWKPKLEKLRDSLASKARHVEALRTLGEITDPRAVPSVWSVFVEKGETHHLTAVQLLGQIDAIEASRGLARLAVLAKSADVRRRATETLRRRDPREYADLLVMTLREKIKYEVRPVGGPGSPGELYVGGEKVNLRRYYAPPNVFVPILPGDTMEQDAWGLPVLVHHNQYSPGPGMMGAMAGNPFGIFDPSQGSDRASAATAARIRSQIPKGLLPDTTSPEALLVASDPIAQAQYVNGQSYRDANLLATTANNIDPGRYFVDISNDQQTRIPVGQLMVAAQRVAKSAADQLKRDVALLDDYNRRITEMNDRIGSVLKTATGEDLPYEPKPWRTWYVDQLGFKYNLSSPENIPTVVENVPLNDQIGPIPIVTTDQMTTQLYRRHSCFARGTPVRTIEGPRSIEDLKVGDLVLTQDTRKGSLAYRPVVMAHRNPPSPTFKVTLDDSAIVTSPSHRFWKAGHGWVMARDLKVGDPIRTLGGVGKVMAIEPDTVQPVFNLDVADDADFFVGHIAALVHDNTLPDLKQVPFDAPMTSASK